MIMFRLSRHAGYRCGRAAEKLERANIRMPGSVRVLGSRLPVSGDSDWEQPRVVRGPEP